MYRCLDRKWVLFHGDSTVEENAIGFVKAVLGGDSAMRMQQHADSFRSLDVLVFRNSTVHHLPSPEVDWLALVRAEAQPVVRITLRTNAQGPPRGKRPRKTYAIRTYTRYCAFVQEFLEMFRGPQAKPDVFVVNSLLWDVGAAPQQAFRVGMERLARYLDLVRTLSPSTRVIYRTANGAGQGFRRKLYEGAGAVEALMHDAVAALLPYVFVRIADVSDTTQAPPLPLPQP